jgi:hypothetical protein
MKLTARNLQEILDIAKESVENQDDCFNYKVGGYDLFVFCDYLDDKEIWVIEPNEVDDNDCSEPMVAWNEAVLYKDYAQLLIACVYLAERYFEED